MDVIAVGQRVMTIFELAAFEAPRHLTLRLDSAMAAAIMGQGAGTYAVSPEGAGARLAVKLAWCYPRRGPARLMRLLLPWGDLFMMKKQLETLKALAERDARAPARAPV